MTQINLRVNGRAHDVEADPATPLLFILRNQLGLTGPKLGCGLEQCGACTVLTDGEAVRCCVRAASEFTETEITTIEGLADDRVGARVQQVFMEEAAAQCGYCTPGIVVATTALLRRNANPDPDQIREALHDQLCRCGSQARVLKAIDRLIREEV